jgi:hypothetical protein
MDIPDPEYLALVLEGIRQYRALLLQEAYKSLFLLMLGNEQINKVILL